MLMRRISIVFVSLTILLASFCVAQAQAFRYPEDTRPTSLLPFFAEDMSSVRMVELLFDGLVFKDKRGDFRGALATKWKMDPDKMGIRFELREGVTWHDGKPFTAADVVFTIEAAKNPKTVFSSKGKYAFIDQVQAEGARAVHFMFKRPISESSL